VHPSVLCRSENDVLLEWRESCRLDAHQVGARIERNRRVEVARQRLAVDEHAEIGNGVSALVARTNQQSGDGGVHFFEPACAIERHYRWARAVRADGQLFARLAQLLLVSQTLRRFVRSGADALFESKG
jgi:hypothetical protein